MPDIAGLVSNQLRPGGTVRPELPSITRATIASTPSTVDEPVMIKVPSLDSRERWLWGPCPWSPRIVSDEEFGFPSEGDLALVVFTEEDEPWIVEWWPYEL